MKKGADLCAKDNSGNYVIHYACTGGLLSLVQYLIEKQTIDKDIKGFRDKTPLHFSCENSHLSIVKYLISKGVNIDAKDKDEQAPLLNAKEPSIIEYLISNGANIETKDKEQRTLLHLACSNGNFNVVKYLVLDGKANIEAKDKGEQTPLHYASFYEQTDIVLFLIFQGANINAVNKDRKRPFDLTKNEEIRNILK